AALAPSFFFAAILGWLCYDPTAWRSRLGVLLVIVGAILLAAKRKAGQPPAGGAVVPQPAAGQAAMMLLTWLAPTILLVWLVDLLFSGEVMADDGGANEIRGGDGTQNVNWTNIIAWWNSPGSGQAISQGGAPSVAAGVGTAMIPPVAPPTDFVVKDDIEQGEEKDGQTYNYSVEVYQTGERTIIPADGRSTLQAYAICRSNNPDYTEETMMSTVRFSYSAPSGFVMQGNEFMGGKWLHTDITVTPPSEAAYQPGIIPGAVYAEASSPAGMVRGHLAVQIKVGPGKLRIDKLERTWLRADGKDTMNVQAWIEADPDAQITEQEQQNIELATYGANANWIGVSSPAPNGYARYWSIQAAQAPDPKSMANPTTVELGFQGKYGGGLFQERVNIDVLPPPWVEFEPREAFLVPGALEETEVLATVKAAAPGEEWEVTAEFKSGDSGAVALGAAEVKGPAQTALKFKFGALPEGRDLASAAFIVKARLTKAAVKDYFGPTETEEALLTVSVTRPGLVFLTPMPVRIPGDGKTEAKFEATVLRYKPGAGGKAGALEVDEAALQPKALTFGKEVAGNTPNATRVFRSAAVQITYVEARGSGLSRRVVFAAKGAAFIPGEGEVHEGEIEVEAPVGPGEKPEDYKRKLKLSLQTIKIPAKYKDYFTEKKLMLQALD
ncbi:MAG: hypothetical protein N3A66_06255, partial [Planctomycetota bacterium]|nr:hypothetical protein [Planctomycetota bacterium]